MGSARGVSGVAMNTSIMEQVPQHFMGRVQNTFYFMGTALQSCLRFWSEQSRRLAWSLDFPSLDWCMPSRSSARVGRCERQCRLKQLPRWNENHFTGIAETRFWSFWNATFSL
jgi:hypothetical protein